MLDRARCIGPADAGRAVFVVHANSATRADCAAWLDAAGFEWLDFDGVDACIPAFAEATPGAVLLGPGTYDARHLRRIHDLNRHVPLLIIDDGDHDSAGPGAVGRLAHDVIEAPLRESAVVRAVTRALDHHAMALRVVELEREVTGIGFPGIIGISPSIREINRQIERVAATDITVAIRGESGTGKELVAHAVHKHSGRRKQPFVAVNCAAIAASLQESELFGHERGAFTGATQRHRGRFEQAHGGTLFLDEVAELSPSTQSALLRVLQERRITRVGGTQEVTVDFRLLTASHKNLRAEVEAGRFREDLYFRIVVYEFEVPPLRARYGDVFVLAQHFLHEFGPQFGTGVPELSREAMNALERYAWPGNVRELLNAIQRALVAAGGARIDLEHLPPPIRDAAFDLKTDGDTGLERETDDDTTQFDTSQLDAFAFEVLDGGVTDDFDRHDTVITPGFLVTPDMTWDEVERRTVELAMSQANGNRSLAARRLGLGRTTLYRKLERYSIR